MSLGLAKRTWKDYPQNQLWGQVHKSYFKTITQRRNLAKKKFLISWDSKNKHNIWPTKSIQLFLNRKFRFIKENFGAPLNSVSLWNLMWILHPLQKFQGQRNIRKLPLKWFKAFRRVSFLSQVPPRSMEERLRDEHPIHKMIPSGKAKIDQFLRMVKLLFFWKTPLCYCLYPSTILVLENLRYWAVQWLAWDKIQVSDRPSQCPKPHGFQLFHGKIIKLIP